jgi:COMM domain containing 4
MAEIAVLSRISSVRMKILCKQVVGHVLGTEIDYEKVLKLTKDTFDTTSDVKAAVAGLDFILVNSAKYDIENEALTQEIQQLGLPKENAEALVKSYRDSKDALRERFGQQSFSLRKLTKAEWRADVVVSSSELDEINRPALQFKLTTGPPTGMPGFSHGAGVDGSGGDGVVGGGGTGVEEVAFSTTMEKFQVLYSELRTARQLMDQC